MRTVQIVFSPTGGTQKAADAITAAWDDERVKIDLCDAKADFSAVRLQPGDVAVIAVPSFGGRVPALAAQRLSLLQGAQTPCVVVCVYGNRAYEDTLVELQDLAEVAGFHVVAGIAAVAEHSIMHQYASGRPDAQDAAQLRGFGEQILAQLGKEGTLDIPGNRPYKKAGAGGLVPKADKTCTACGLCAQVCPAQAIDRADLRSTDGKKCISCMRCVTACPQKARKVNSVMVAVAAQAIKKACSVKKQNELFL